MAEKKCPRPPNGIRTRPDSTPLPQHSPCASSSVSGICAARDVHRAPPSPLPTDALLGPSWKKSCISQPLRRRTAPAGQSLLSVNLNLLARFRYVFVVMLRITTTLYRRHFHDMAFGFSRLRTARPVARAARQSLIGRQRWLVLRRPTF
jgi:hypothetical protein